MASAEPIQLPAPAIDLIVPPGGKWAREYQAFRRLLPELLKTHFGQYVAFHEGQIIGSGQDKLAVALEVFRKVGNVAIHVGFVSEKPEPVARSGLRRVLPPSGAVS